MKETGFVNLWFKGGGILSPPLNPFTISPRRGDFGPSACKCLSIGDCLLRKNLGFRPRRPGTFGVWGLGFRV